ncbi:MAG: DNA repair protein RadC [Chloroflexaceae bacterium]|nr:DNA repair protein RadC [Chloroflexaceae bacterium]NJO07884.1 DNA repair protein RadC [Chloroflexaceae bacterium]
MYRLRIREMPDHERPRERLRDYGPEALADAELLAILLRVGVSGVNVVQLSQQLLKDFGGWHGLQQTNFHTLRSCHGMGEAKAAQLKAALEIGRRLAMLSFEERFQITSPGDVAKLMQVQMSHYDQEHLNVICLDTKNRVMKIQNVYVGTLDAAGLRVGEIFKEALKINSAALIMVHNHPSGDPTPSPEDIAITRQIVEAGRLLDIDVLDHLVIGHGRYVSLRERGVGGFG